MGDNLYWMITITDRNQSQKFLSFYKTYGIESCSARSAKAPPRPKF